MPLGCGADMVNFFAQNDKAFISPNRSLESGIFAAQASLPVVEMTKHTKDTKIGWEILTANGANDREFR